MKIKVPTNLNSVNVIRRAGYGLVRDPRNPVQSYARRLGGGIYPRFHAYLEGDSVNLHLDQKQASYEGSSAHSGEYDGEVVEREGERIKSMMANLVVSEKQPEKEAEGFWSKLFNG